MHRTQKFIAKEYDTITGGDNYLFIYVIGVSLATILMFTQATSIYM